MVETDELLMLAVRDGEVTQLGTLFDRHHRVLFDYLVRMTGDRAIAEDLVQEVFLRILRYRKTFQEKSRFRSWMFGIARNVRLDHHRKHQTEVLFPDDFEIQGHSTFALENLERQHEAMLLERAMFKLSEDKREVLVLSRYKEMKYEEIAELLGCEVGTVKTRVHRALKELRDIFLKFSGEKTPCNAKKSETASRII